jgi:hypothetical protein
MKQLKNIGVFCFVIGTDRMFQLDTTLKKKLGYVGYVYAVTKMTL